MTTANFKTQITFKQVRGSISNRQIEEVTHQVYGSVTLKNDGKVSISILNRNSNSYQMNDQANKIAKEIVASNFNHPAITSLKQDDNKLITILTTYTADLKITYIQQCKEWANNHFDKCVIDSKPTEQESEILKDWRNNETKAVREQIRSRMHKASEVVYKGKDNYIASAEKNAIEHYEISLSKLAKRIADKNINVDNMKVVSSGVGVNINITLSDDNKSVKAWTIIASGYIQRPHYRYLVK